MSLYFSARGLNSEKTEIKSHERAAELAKPLQGKMTLSIAQRHPDWGMPRHKGPVRYSVHLWNWQTQRGAEVFYEEDLEDAVEYVGILDPSRPSRPPTPRGCYWPWC